MMDTARQQARLLLSHFVNEKSQAVFSEASVAGHAQHHVADTEAGKLMDIMGNDNTAMQVSRIFGNPHKVNISEILDDAGFEGLL